jgi:hypothetical protein
VRAVEAREAAWNRVTEQFSSLAERVRSHYQNRPAEEPGPSEANDSVRDAMRSLGDAADRLASTVGDAVRDPDVQSDAKRAANSLVDAIGLTLSQIGGEIRSRSERARGGAARDDDVWEEPRVEVVDQVPERATDAADSPASPTTGPTAGGATPTVESPADEAGPASDDPQFRSGP